MTRDAVTYHKFMHDWREILCWHKWKLVASSMYGDPALDCVKCEVTHFTDDHGIEVFFLRLLKKMVN